MEENERKYKDIELRSEEVQEVMNHISPWVVRWGITVVFIILFVILIGCWVFKYPDALTAEVTLTTVEPPAFILSRSAGRIDTLYVCNGAIVQAEEYLGVIRNSASTKDVIWLINCMAQWRRTDYECKAGMEFFSGKRIQLGEIQSAYALFITTLTDYARFMEQNYYARKLMAQHRKRNSQQSYFYLVEREQVLVEKDMKLAQSMYDRDSTLHAGNAMIAAEFEQSGSRYLQSLRSKEASRMGLLQAEIQLVQQEEELLDISKQAYEEEQKHRINLKNALEQLKAQLSAWEQSYLLKSPIKGEITFMTVWSRNQNVQLGETVFVVQPSDTSEVVGKALLPLQGSGKVQIGQRVHIRLNNYPDQEFGYIKGKVQSISPVPTAEGMYVVEIDLPDGLLTNYGKLLPASRELKGTADIILANRNVLERLLAPLRKIMEYEE